ncbi:MULTISPECIES: dTDP-4-dehydrorhamnose reductase [Sphingobium]|uniref:dTDP-4-dehydrorhamnose reductase n=1 Tax=Sphingobium cupriresistens LL01 TaxID=1420583 RepID=A0A0J7Y1C4_9SPHN|nr:MULTISPECIES: dTDP-4-dehydrorhamnose reductase [Sphingobium]KMS57228.1 dTDP-4-dehydrorhamnose reductase [Sphingobium cupriresistens LL01]MBJ7376845.1 dTDP-4-dehydrorhamnose reductase [Sphingobium sp.]WCP14229.1 dTDP-4-dehydrorhamnose reductase [Sphingobium sp. AntQ-1]
MKIVITGCNGQLGRSLQATAPVGAELICLGSADLDISDAEAVTQQIADHCPDIVVNAAAYTAVDRAEQEEERAFAINGAGAGHLAAAARRQGARFVHVSTDFVFDGASGTPYPVNAATNPMGAYGRSKLAGEQAAGPDALIVRTAWVYAPEGGNFVRTMLRLMGERPEVRVVADQIGTPTYAPALADAIWRLLAADAKGMHHYTDSGAASWYDFAVAIQEEALTAGLLTHQAVIIPIATSDYPTPAQRPSYSVLDKSATFAAIGGPAPHWRHNLRVMIAAIKAQG